VLFDLRGRRRRAVQATYLTLAVLMGGGLVLFGVGGDVSGGLLDAFKGGGGGNSNKLVEDRIDKNKPLAARGNVRATKELVRDYYQLANGDIPSGATSLPESALGNLRNSQVYWQRYLKATKKPDPSLAALAVQSYGLTAGSNKKDAKGAQEAAAIVAEAAHEERAQAYLQLVQYATLAGDTRTADLAGQKAIDVAPKAQRAEVKAQIKTLKTPPQTQQQPSGG
jgi:hypothetical protein